MFSCRFDFFITWFCVCFIVHAQPLLFALSVFPYAAPKYSARSIFTPLWSIWVTRYALDLHLTCINYLVLVHVLLHCFIALLTLNHYCLFCPFPRPYAAPKYAARSIFSGVWVTRYTLVLCLICIILLFMSFCIVLLHCFIVLLTLNHYCLFCPFSTPHQSTPRGVFLLHCRVHEWQGTR